MQRRPGFPARLPGSGPAAVRATPVAPAARNPVAAPPVGVGLDSAAVRARMVQKLAAGGITSAAVLQAMGTVERHRFVDSALVNQAYEDTSLPIGLGQTISKPNVVARMCELLVGAEGARTDGLGRVLEIGTGCGYQAAVLSLVAQEVFSIERIRPLHEQAKANLRPLRVPNIRLHYGDGMLGLPQAAPFSAIILAAAGMDVPEALLGQLAIGGRLIAPVVASAPGGPGQTVTQQLLLIERLNRHRFHRTALEAVFFVPLKSGTI